MVEGPTVMLGYWGCAPHGNKPYATGDIVRRVDEDCYEYIGRNDEMLKVRGYRIEAGDVEAALNDHPAIDECAVTVRGNGLEARLIAYLVCRRDAARPSLLAIKSHVAQRLPRYMIVDNIRFLDALPRNRNGKVDRRKLAELAAHEFKKGETLHANA